MYRSWCFRQAASSRLAVELCHLAVSCVGSAEPLQQSGSEGHACDLPDDRQPGMAMKCLTLGSLMGAKCCGSRRDLGPTPNCSCVQIVKEKFLVYVNDLLSSGVVADLCSPEDKDNFINGVSKGFYYSKLAHDDPPRSLYGSRRCTWSCLQWEGGRMWLAGHLL